jgi:hypothetical protein
LCALLPLSFWVVKISLTAWARRATAARQEGCPAPRNIRPLSTEGAVALVAAVEPAGLLWRVDNKRLLYGAASWPNRRSGGTRRPNRDWNGPGPFPGTVWRWRALSSPGAAPPAASEDHARNPPQPSTPGVTPPASKRSPGGRVLRAQTHPGPSLPLRGRRGSKVRSGKRDTGTHHTWTPPQRTHDTTPANTFHPTTPAHSRPTHTHAHTHHCISSSARAHARARAAAAPVRTHARTRHTSPTKRLFFGVLSTPFHQHTGAPAHDHAPAACYSYLYACFVLLWPWGCSRFVGGTLAFRVLSRFSLVVCARTLPGYPVV